ncbi:MAG: CPXCG motif-containing cysteine-rich protein [Sulfurospirillaceae bacterium]|nr:CPXCG motif-containing cysteine-rich protein [Sulfurospirillaceae bacterium]
MEERTITCPYCWESISLYLEPDIGEESITVVEDCYVCCSPIEITYAARDGVVKIYDHHAIEGNSF